MDHPKLTRASRLLSCCAYGVCLLLMALAAVMYVRVGVYSPALVLPAGVVCALGAGLLLYWLDRATRRAGEWALLAALLCLCFAVKLAWVLFARIQPSGDYAVFYAHGEAFALRGNLGGSTYLALFPHIFGYSLFLSWFFRLFGVSELLPVVLNVLLSTLSCALLFFLGKRLGGRRTALCAGLLWTFFPSQIIYNMFVLSEPLYTTLILGYLLLLFRLDDALTSTGKLWVPALLGAGGAGLLAAVNLCRPVAAILIIATVLWLVPVRLEGWRSGDFRRRALVFLGALLAVYFLLGQAGTAYFTYRVGESPTSVPGFNIYVGFNAASNGAWNMEDSQMLSLLLQSGTPAQVQSELLDLALERITSGEIDFLHLFLNKLYTFLSVDNACVMYAPTIRHPQPVNLICNIFYYMTLFLSMVGLGRAIRLRDRGGLFPVMLYFVGLTLAHMLVEVAGRYHYSLLVPLVVLAAGGLDVVMDRGTDLIKKLRKR